MSRVNLNKHISNEAIEQMRSGDLFEVTTDFSKIADVDVIIICVPTPLSGYVALDLGPVLGTGQAIMPHLQKGQLVVLVTPTLARQILSLPPYWSSRV